jgi:hypothetical protein
MVTCVFDFDEFWNALGALATVVTGFAAVYVALAAHRLSTAQHSLNEGRSRRAAKAFSVLAVTELFARKGVAEVLHKNMTAALEMPGVITLLQAAVTIERAPSLQISEQLVTSLSLGDMPDGIPQELAGVYSSSAHFPALLGMALEAIKNTQNADGEFFDADRATLLMARDSLATFLGQLKSVGPKLERLAQPDRT